MDMPWRWLRRREMGNIGVEKGYKLKSLKDNHPVQTREGYKEEPTGAQLEAPPEFNGRRSMAFSHIFAGVYVAGYYSYKWAEVLSADAFLAFEAAGLDYSKAVTETSWKFQETILARGGGKAPLEVFIEFRGHEHSPEALLRHDGLLLVTASA
ncbi:hypothetical protein SLA2020_192210 [Shorea laevis]